MCMWVYVHNPEGMSGLLLSHFLILLRQDLLLNLEFTGSWQDPAILLSLPLTAMELTYMQGYFLLFMWVLGIQTQDSHLA